MTLQEALYKSIEEFGVEILNEPRLINIISDIHGFDDSPGAKFILLRLINDYSNKTWEKGNLNIERIQERLNKSYGIDKDLTKKVVVSLKESSLAYYNYCKNCENVTEEDLKNGISDEYGAVYSKDGSRLLKGVDIPEYRIKNGTKIICNSAFKGCFTLKSVIIPHGVITIGRLSFSQTSLEKLHLPETVKYISGFAFGDNKELKEINIPKNIKEIAPFNIFIGCINLNNIILDTSKLIINQGVLYSSDYVYAISCIPKLITSNPHINENTVFLSCYIFAGCKNIKELFIPQSVLKIADGAFMLCPNLKSVSLPESLRMIGNKCFSKCYRLTDIKVREGINEDYIEDEEYIKENNLYDKYEKFKKYLEEVSSCLGKSAFENCKSLYSVELPWYIGKIKANAFEGCVSLTNIYLRGPLYEADENVFRSITSLEHLFVPIEDYYVEDYRKKFKKIFPSGKDVVQPCAYTMANFYEEMDPDNPSEWFQMYPDWYDGE